MNFVDLAICAVFGNDVQYIPIGAAYDKADVRTTPNYYEGNYFMADAPEGMIIPMAVNAFHYPHPNLKIEDFLPAAAITEGIS